MSANDFADVLTDAWGASTDDTARARGVLKEFCDGVAQASGPAVDCTLVPGFRVNIGQQYRATVARTAPQFEDILFRAYIDATGWPVHLDLYDEDLVECGDEAALRKALKGFLSDSLTVDKLRIIASM